MLIDHDGHVIGNEYLDRRRKSRRGKRMSVDAYE